MGGPARIRFETAEATLAWSPGLDALIRGDTSRGATPFVDALAAMRMELRGEPQSAAIYFPVTSEIALEHPNEFDPCGGSVVVAPLDGGSSPQACHPIRIGLHPRDHFGIGPLIGALPRQGRPLAPNTEYLAFVRSSPELAPDPTWSAIASGAASPFDADTTARLRRALDRIAIDFTTDPSDLAGVTLFRTGDATAPLRQAREDVLASERPALIEPLTRTDVYPDYCVFEGRIGMPSFQAGVPPFLIAGQGRLAYENGHLVRQRTEVARVLVTIPRRRAPSSIGYRTAMFVRTGTSTDRAAIDRGPVAANGAPLTPGSGLAGELSRAGFAVVQVDGPHTGLRNITHGDEQFLVFNITNPGAARDNLMQSALDLASIANVLDGWVIDSSSCPGAETTSVLDGRSIALFGHSMGASIAPLAVAIEPRFTTLVASGAGASWIENVLHKTNPIPTVPIARALAGYQWDDPALHELDPMLNLLQAAAEGVDSQLFGSMIRARGVDVLVFQGIEDTYIQPPVANALSLALELDLAGSAFDDSLASRFTPLAELFRLYDGRTVEIPVAGNRGARTRVVVQFPSDGIQDGHEILFQRADARTVFECFFASISDAAPPIVRSDCR